MKRSIMVVEDDEDILELMEILLTRLGYETRLLSDGILALDEIGKARPSLVLLDVMMTPINGWEFLDRLRSNPAISDIPVILFTAHPDVKERASRLNDPRLGVMVKPVAPDELERAIARFLKPDQ